MVLLALHLSPGGIIAWIIIGLLAGAIAGRLARGSGFGCLGDIIIGLVGAFIGGLVLSFFVRGDQTTGFLGTLVVALIGALILLFLVRLARGEMW
jgi:uncharacterized membrane protein YeaQ/YmgE (transglycosylase-associated protein family)